MTGYLLVGFEFQGGHLPGKPGKAGEFKSGRAKVRENVFLHARTLANWFSGKSLKLLPPDVRF